MEAFADIMFGFQRLIGMVCRLNWNPITYPGGTGLKIKNHKPCWEVNSKWYIYKRRKC